MGDDSRSAVMGELGKLNSPCVHVIELGLLARRPTFCSTNEKDVEDFGVDKLGYAGFGISSSLCRFAIP